MWVPCFSGYQRRTEHSPEAPPPATPGPNQPLCPADGGAEGTEDQQGNTEDGKRGRALTEGQKLHPSLQLFLQSLRGGRPCPLQPPASQAAYTGLS